MPTASNLASTTAGASRKKKTPAKPSVPKQRGRKAYPRDENGSMVRPNKENQLQITCQFYCYDDHCFPND